MRCKAKEVWQEAHKKRSPVMGVVKKDTKEGVILTARSQPGKRVPGDVELEWLIDTGSG